MKKYQKEIFEIIKNNFVNEEVNKEIKIEDEFVSDLGFDSVRFMGLFSILEDEFDVPIISNDKNYIFFSIITIEDLIDAVNSILE